MSKEDFVKLATIEADAQENVIESITVNGTELVISDKGVSFTVPTTVAELTDAEDYALVADLGDLASKDIVSETDITAALLAKVNGAIKAIASKSGSNGTLTVTKTDDSTADVALTGVAHDITYDSTALTLTIPQVGSTNLVVNLPRDNFVESGSYNPETECIELVLKDETVISIPASSLIDIYTSGSGEDDTVKITVSEDNEISATINVDTSTVLAIDEDGAITIDLSAYATVSAMNTALSGKVDKNGTDRLMTAAEGTKLGGISAGATVTEASAINGNIKIDTVETQVYTLPITVLDSGDTFVLDGGRA